MLNVSYAFERKIAEESKVLVKADVRLADGTLLRLEGDDFVMGGVKFDDAVSSSGSFDIGAAIINQCTVTLNNYDERFSGYDFSGARIEPSVGVELDGGAVEWLRKGVYWLDQPAAMPSTIQLTALDNMSRLDRDYAEVATRYPASLRTIAMEICARYNLTLANTAFPNSDYAVPKRPDGALTSHDVISYAAQCAGCWARFDNEGKLRLDWYDESKFDGEDWLDGGEFDEGYTIQPYGPADPYVDPYLTGDTADGGTFDDYSAGDSADGGTFDHRDFAVIHALLSSTIVTDDVVITGVSVTAQDEDSDAGGHGGETALFGEPGYVLSIADNPLIPYGKASDVAARVGSRVVGLRFRPLDLSALGSPAIEAGDPAIVIDSRQRSCRTFITRTTFQAGAYQTFACSAETPSRNSAAGFSAQTKAIKKLRDELAKERTAREIAIENMAEKLGKSSGMFVTSEDAENGGKVYYVHDKPTIGESQTVWKLTADAIGFSTDGGKTYPYALDATGNAILERVYTIGLDASYITSGALSVMKGSKEMFYADVDTGEVRISAESLTIDSSSIIGSIDAARAHYGYCPTASVVAEKAATCTSFELRDGALVCVRFANPNTAKNPTLNVNGTGARPIYLGAAPIDPIYSWMAEDVVTLVYDEASARWRVADAGASSKIVSTAQGFSVTVQNLEADMERTYATKGELSVKGNEIVAQVSSRLSNFAYCLTREGVREKTVAVSDFKLVSGATVTILFQYANTADYPTLNVSGTGALPIIVDNHAFEGNSFYSWDSLDTITFVYDNNRQWRVCDSGAMGKIRVTSEQIELKVSKGDVSSQLSVESGDITIRTPRLSWDAGNTSMTKNGYFTCTSGKIAGFNIESTRIYDGRVAHTGSGTGVLMNHDGFSACDGTLWTGISSGSVRGGKSYSSGGYINFCSQRGSGDYGIKLAGKGVISLLAPSITVGDYVSTETAIGAAYVAQSSKMVLVHQIGSWSGPNFTYTPGNYGIVIVTFTKGLLTGVEVH